MRRRAQCFREPLQSLQELCFSRCREHKHSHSLVQPSVEPAVTDIKALYSSCRKGLRVGWYLKKRKKQGRKVWDA